MKTATVTPKPAREVTGTTVLICFVGFFGVVATVNGIMMHAAITTFAGTETIVVLQGGPCLQTGRSGGHRAIGSELAG